MDVASTNISPYTQESQFEQAINTDISDLWKTREEGYLRTFDKRKLFWCKLTHPSHSKAIVVVNGRIESAWKYQELFYDLFSQGYDVYSYDHRGQGLSDRLIDDPQMGYVEEFDDYIKDLDNVIKHFSLGQYDQRYLLAHSMGGTIATRYLQTQYHDDANAQFNAVALSAPMFGVNMPSYLRPIALPYAQLITGLKGQPVYAPGHKEYYPKPFDVNPLSQSHIRYHWFRDLYETMPQLKLGGPTTRWVWQGLMACKQSLQQTRQISIPMLIMQAGEESIVSNPHQDRLFSKLSRTNKAAEMLVIQGSKHELLFEQDEYRNQAMNGIVDFFKAHQ
ncbi:alpha/beta fold hydrolase [Vibrio mexicanus]|uniref:alpha/beta fold hydrolase n=1 Tax=Vibrio mexicanus TaxID=1004326 RepID=UPI00063CF0F6|nr:alpha/beta fold hydrolase [Vibrio mexicanus]